MDPDEIVTMATVKPLPDARLQALQFTPLTADGTNYLEWANDAQVALGAEELTLFLNWETAEGRPEVLKF